MSEFERWWKDNYDGFEGPSGEVERVAAEVWNAAIEAAAKVLEGQQRFVAAGQVRKLSQKETDRGVPIPAGADCE